MFCKGHGSTCITLPKRGLQVHEEPSNRTLSSERSHFKLRLARKVLRKLSNTHQKNKVIHTQKEPLRIVGHKPKSNSNSSSGVKGFQVLTATAGKPLEQRGRGRSSFQNRQRPHIGTAEKVHPPKKDLAKLALEFPTSFILKRIPLGLKKVSLLAQEKPGSWIALANSKERCKFMRQAKEKSVTSDFIKNSSPIFTVATRLEIPRYSSWWNVSDSLLIINTIHGFKYLLLSSQQNDLVLIGREEAIKYENKLDHEVLLDVFIALNSRFSKHQVI
jgi:hypothetical protein